MGGRRCPRSICCSRDAGPTKTQGDYTPWATVKVITEKSLVPKAPT